MDLQSFKAVKALYYVFDLENGVRETRCGEEHQTPTLIPCRRSVSTGVLISYVFRIHCFLLILIKRHVDVENKENNNDLIKIK